MLKSEIMRSFVLFRGTFVPFFCRDFLNIDINEIFIIINLNQEITIDRNFQEFSKSVVALQEKHINIIFVLLYIPYRQKREMLPS